MHVEIDDLHVKLVRQSQTVQSAIRYCFSPRTARVILIKLSIYLIQKSHGSSKKSVSAKQKNEDR